ncbi:N-acetylgalactosamine kinase [Mactra antiquata]
MADDPPPIITEIDANYKERFSQLGKKFQSKYDCEPVFFARAPGRVNIIGEHIDYCGYGVLPIAIDQDIVIAVRQTDDDTLYLSNIDDKYSDYKCNVKDFEINKDQPDWHNYFLCGLKGIMELLSLENPVGMQCMVDGSVPSSAGLSSSSALVCCAALCTMQANGKSWTKKELADMCAQCERYIGTIGGGMDQAISFMAQPGMAKKIDFNPLRQTNVALPDGVSFVISNCCVEKNKAASSDFNTRVVECRLASQVLAKMKGFEWREMKRLADLQTKLNVGLQEMENVVKECLHESQYTKAEICDVLGVTADILATTSLSPNTLHVENFCLYQRATHVYSEARRVEDFQNVCIERPTDAAIKLGELMNGSFESCSKLYECSCPELDQLVAICRKHGAIGSRLTGAGWGGCAVSLVPNDKVTEFLDGVKQSYYIPRGLESKVNNALFVTKSGGGAAVYIP